MLPLISVLFIGYNRSDLLTRTVKTFLNNTDYDRNKLELILCDDASNELELANMKLLPFDKILTASKNSGLGANSNKGLKSSSGKYILQLQDDWVCKGPNDYLLKGVKLLEENGDIDIVRYRLGMEYPYETIKTCGFANYLKIKNEVNNAVTPFVYSDNPHLKRRSFHEEIGYYLEETKMENTEINMCDKFISNNKVAVYLQGYEEVFLHIGEEKSYRTKTFVYKLKIVLHKIKLVFSNK